MRVLLVASVTPTYKKYNATSNNLPNGILFIAAVLEKHGHKVEVYEGFIDSRQPKDFVSFKPDIIGFSVLAGPNLEGSIAQSKEFKEIMPEVKVVWGNVYPSLLPEQTLAEPYIDYVVIGAGEYTLLELVQCLENGRPKLEEIKGLAYKKDGKIFINEPRPLIENMDELPDPAWHLVDVKKYREIDLNTSRGCVYHCTYCYNRAFNRGYTGYLSAERIVSQIEHMQKQYGAKHIRFNDDNFAFNRKRLREFCKLLIRRKLKITWGCDSRADLGKDDITLMAKSGCVVVHLGLETGSQRMLDFIQKGITVEEMEKTFWPLVKHKIRTTVYIMYGFPTETIEDFRMTHELLERLDNPYYLYNRFVPYPRTVLFDYCVANGLITPPRKLDDWPEFLMLYSQKVNLSEVPQEMIDEAITNFRNTYAIQRFRFTVRHNPSYFWIILSNPLKFFREIKDLIKNHLTINKLKKYGHIQGGTASARHRGKPS